MQRRLFLAGGGALAGLGLWRARGWAAERLGLDPSADFALTGQLTQGGWARGKAPADTRQLTFNGRQVRLAADGAFLIAFDRDSGPRGELLAELRDGGSSRGGFAISPRAWQIERIPLGPRPGTPPNEEYARRRAAETARINAARAIDHQVDGWRQKFIYPAFGRISGRFGSQRIYNGTPGSYHSGMDIATGSSGTPFVAPADGVVILAAAESFSLEGRLLMIDHGMGLNSAFLHCSSHAVKEGDTVRQGQFIGRVGATGRATGPHLHWSIKWREARLDPLLFVGPMPG
ncbi:MULTISPECIES: M23 family metallopeptidase [unclassified Novosphingobium]|uniref:M23 family metallopeptidase n=1 Tax=unclassified Novosphingobium TaxID=2644732 RepID=UPI000EC648D8|nr:MULTISPECIES: M23 family metallopeptidase [unclassified Novosphingobium]HCF25228.1 peptidase [Novosphingobium sp.]HQV02359.1 M23 family metallopeptidase [Novosphingobium sp.]